MSKKYFNESWLGQRFLVKIVKMGNLGQAVAKHEGRVVFVDKALPGEVLYVEVVRDNKQNYCFASIVDIEEAYFARVAERCPVRSLGGGCCTFSHVLSTETTKLKETILNDTIQRKLNFKELVSLNSLAKGDENWRTRVRYQTDSEGNLGSFRAKSKELITEEIGCVQPVTSLTSDLPSADYPANTTIKVVVDDYQKRFILANESKPSNMAVKLIDGDPFLVNPGNFWQPHKNAAVTYERIFKEMLRNVVQESKIRIAWDLYAGNGFFTYLLTKYVPELTEVHGVEYVTEVVKIARKNFKSIKNLVFHSGLVENIIKNLSTPDLVVLDPSRAGISREVVKILATVKPKNIIMFGCDLENFVRDIQRLIQNNYSIEEMHAYDAFPITYHTETVARLLLK